MGVSVSASTAIIVAGLFFAFTAFYPVAANGFDRVTDGERAVHEGALERQNTAVTVTNATYNATADELVVNVTNDGSTGLVVSDTTLLADNEYVDLGTANTTVYDDGNATGETDLWLAEETLEITLTPDDVDGSLSDVDLVVVATEQGVRDTERVA